MGFTVESMQKKPALRPIDLLLPPVALVFVIVLLVFRVIWTAVIVDGDSMVPALQPGDRILVSHGYGFPERGDIVSIRSGVPGATALLKRVVGLPGETVVLVGDHAYVKDAPEGPWPVVARPIDLRREIAVPRDSVCVLGDNREVSVDSRTFGPVPLDDVAGRAVAVFWPPGRARLLDDAASTH